MIGLEDYICPKNIHYHLIYFNSPFTEIIFTVKSRTIFTLNILIIEKELYINRVLKECKFIFWIITIIYL